MKKIVIGAVISMIVIGSAVAQTNKQAMYSDKITIFSTDNKVLASIDTFGKVSLVAGTSYDDIINILIERMLSQNKDYQDRMKIASGLIEDARARANATTTKASEIFQIWNPPQEPQKEVKKEEPKPVESKVPEVKKEEPKKSWWQKATGK